MNKEQTSEANCPSIEPGELPNRLLLLSALVLGKYFTTAENQKTETHTLNRFLKFIYSYKLCKQLVKVKKTSVTNNVSFQMRPEAGIQGRLDQVNIQNAQRKHGHINSHCFSKPEKRTNNHKY